MDCLTAGPKPIHFKPFAPWFRLSASWCITSARLLLLKLDIQLYNELENKIEQRPRSGCQEDLSETMAPGLLGAS